MKIVQLILLVLMISCHSFAQNTFPTTGNVGIGTTTPATALEISNTTGSLKFDPNGTSLTVSGPILNTNKLPRILLGFVGDSQPAMSQTAYQHNNIALTFDAYPNGGAWSSSYLGSNFSLYKANNELIIGFKSNIPVGGIFTYDLTSGVRFSNDGKLGIGGAAGNAKLYVNGPVGIGTSSPKVPLQVSQTGNNVVGNMTLLSTFTDPTGVKGISLGYNQASQAGIIYSENNTGIGSPLEFWTYNGSSFAARMTFTQAGRLGIGTSSPDAPLTVNGTVHAKSVLVDQTVAQPDYVFDEGYDLVSLKDVKTYIDKNHHLPEIPSAEQVAKDGINLGEMNTKLLKKIEELTLYLIEKDKQDKMQNCELTQLRQINKLLQRRLNKLQLKLTSISIQHR